MVDAAPESPRGLVQTGVDWPYPVECWEFPENSALAVGAWLRSYPWAPEFLKSLAYVVHDHPGVHAVRNIQYGN